MGVELAGSTGPVDWNDLTGYSGESSTTRSEDLMDVNVFLELLVTQLQNQDPLSPMENQQFTEQLAQLTQVEQLRTANMNLETLNLYQSSINNAQSVSMIGKEVKAIGDSFDYSEGSVTLSFMLASEAAEVKVTIFGPEGEVVQVIEQGNMESGLGSVTWNGKDLNNSPCQAGRYTFRATAKDNAGNEVNASTLIHGEVLGVIFENGIPMLDIEGQQVSIGDVYEVTSP